MNAQDRASREGQDRVLEEEQAYVSMLYGRLDGLREKVRANLAEVESGPTDGTDEGRTTRDSYAGTYAQRAAQLAAVERGLCFGRLDLTGESFHVGRIGLFDDDHEPLLVDWRAPAAQPFYRATPAVPLDVVRRRHIRTKDREVIGVDDDVLDPETLREAAAGDGRASLTGEAALMASLLAGRTGRMNDIVATIQGEQDLVIRSELPGILVVDGGPGTGKTVVALHRAAYLLYTHREQLAGSGVLVVGPTPTFLHYIDQVLPALGETDVVAATLPDLYPGTRPSGPEAPETARVKGDPRMAEVIRAACRDRERVPDEALRVRVAGDELVLDPETCERARRATRERAAENAEPHNRARRHFVEQIVGVLTGQVLDRLRVGTDAGDDEPALKEGEEDVDITQMIDTRSLRSDIAGDPAVHEVLDQLWPELTPERLLRELYADEDNLLAAAPELSDRERAALHRPAAAGWTAADIPLLDEAVGLLGPTDAQVYDAAQAQDAAAGEEGQRFQMAEEMLAAGAFDGTFTGLVPRASEIAEHLAEPPDRGPAAMRALGDREWTYGHVIVDEAQELSAMDWRVLMRRCPRRSMTVVGDPAQRSAVAGTATWGDLLEPYAAGRWRRHTLTLNYRTPAEIMAVAGDVLAAINPGAEQPESVRETGEQPRARRTRDLAGTLVEVARTERAELASGTLAVLVPEPRVAELTAVLGRELDGVAGAGDADALDAPVLVLAASQAKGLEFDVVIVAEPAEVIAASEQGLGDLYVAVTRATRRLGVVHTGDLPEVLSRLARPSTA